MNKELLEKTVVDLIKFKESLTYNEIYTYLVNSFANMGRTIVAELATDIFKIRSIIYVYSEDK